MEPTSIRTATGFLFNSVLLGSKFPTVKSFRTPNHSSDAQEGEEEEAITDDEEKDINNGEEDDNQKIRYGILPKDCPRDINWDEAMRELATLWARTLPDHHFPPLCVR